MKFLSIRDLKTKSAVVRTTQNLSFEEDAPLVPPHTLSVVLMKKNALIKLTNTRELFIKR
jgi:hypothetical protein